LKILLVDDDEDLLELTTKRLEKKGFQVSMACGYHDALKIFDSEMKIVLSDLHLGQGKSGIDLVVALRAQGFSDGFFLITGDDPANIDVPATLKTDSKFKIITKPYHFEDLLAKLKEVN
jgi:DNA-binding response OmpR family regulator